MTGSEPPHSAFDATGAPRLSVEPGNLDESQRGPGVDADGDDQTPGSPATCRDRKWLARRDERVLGPWRRLARVDGSVRVRCSPATLEGSPRRGIEVLDGSG